MQRKSAAEELQISQRGVRGFGYDFLPLNKRILTTDLLPQICHRLIFGIATLYNSSAVTMYLKFPNDESRFLVGSPAKSVCSCEIYL